MPGRPERRALKRKRYQLDKFIPSKPEGAELGSPVTAAVAMITFFSRLLVAFSNLL